MKLNKKPPTEVKAEQPRRSVTFSLQFGGENDTLRSLSEVFSWTEAMP